MALTLKEASIGMADKVDMAVVDTFRRNSALLDMLTFDNVISPGTNGSTLTYGYLQLRSPSSAGLRSEGNYFDMDEAIKEKKTATAAIMGGAFEVDRVVQQCTGSTDEVAFQAEQKIKATANLFHNLVINAIPDSEGFEGLSRALTDTENEKFSQISLATSADLDANYNAFLDELDEMLAHVDGKPDLLMMNTKMLIKLRSIARRAGYYERSTDEFGNSVETYAGIPMMDMGKFYDGYDYYDVVPVDSQGKTAIYAACLGLDGLHGISPTGNSVIRAYLPDVNTPGPVKMGEVELVAGVVLKNTRKAGVLRNINVGV